MGEMCTYLEKRFRMRPLGVVSKKVMGDRKMACDIRSCSLRDAYTHTREPGFKLASPARHFTPFFGVRGDWG